MYLSREAAYDDPATTRELRAAHEHVLTGPTEDLARRRTSPDDPPLSDELMSYALYGAFQTMRMRASWDERFSMSDVMWTNVALNLAVLALYDGTIDVVALKAEVRRDSIEELAAIEPPEPALTGDLTARSEGERMNTIAIDRTPAPACQTCYEACFMDVFRWDDAEEQPIVAYAEDCVECNKCELECPEECIKVIVDYDGKYWPEVV